MSSPPNFDGHGLVTEEAGAALYMMGRSFIVTLDGKQRSRGAESTIRSMYAGMVAAREASTPAGGAAPAWAKQDEEDWEHLAEHDYAAEVWTLGDPDDYAAVVWMTYDDSGNLEEWSGVVGDWSTHRAGDETEVKRQAELLHAALIPGARPTVGGERARLTPQLERRLGDLVLSWHGESNDYEHEDQPVAAKEYTELADELNDLLVAHGAGEPATPESAVAKLRLQMDPPPQSGGFDSGVAPPWPGRIEPDPAPEGPTVIPTRSGGLALEAAGMMPEHREPHEAFSVEAVLDTDGKPSGRFQALLWAHDGDDTFESYDAAVAQSRAVLASAPSLAPDETLPCKCVAGNRWTLITHCGGHAYPDDEAARFGAPMQVASVREPTREHRGLVGDLQVAAVALAGRAVDSTDEQEVYEFEMAAKAMQEAAATLSTMGVREPLDEDGNPPHGWPDITDWSTGDDGKLVPPDEPRDDERKDASTRRLIERMDAKLTVALANREPKAEPTPLPEGTLERLEKAKSALISGRDRLRAYGQDVLAGVLNASVDGLTAILSRTTGAS